MWMSFDQSARLKSVYDATKSDRLDFKKLCQAVLIDAFVLSQRRQHLPLR
jgi:hypothetical protein